MTTLKNNGVVTNEEKALIQGIIKGEEKAKERIVTDSIKIMKNTIYESRAPLDDDETENLIYGFPIKVLEEIPWKKIKSNLFGYIKRMSKNYLADQGREKINKKTIQIGETKFPVKKINPDYDIEDSQVTPPGSREYYDSEEDRIKRVYYALIPLKVREGIEKSLESIEELYRFRKQVRIARNKYDKTHIILKDLNALKEKIERVAGRFIRKKAIRYEYFRSKGAFDFDDENKLTEFEREEFKEFENLGFEGMLPILAYSKINKLISHAEIALFFNLRYPSRKKFFDLTGPLSLSREDIKKNIPDMRIEPPRLMYAIWSKVKELRRGTKEINHEKMKQIFAYQKIVTKNTDKMFLFESVRNDLSNYPTIRKLQYHKPKFKGFYKKLVENIYKTSFSSFQNPRSRNI